MRAPSAQGGREEERGDMEEMIKGMENIDCEKGEQFDAESKDSSEGRRQTKSLIPRLDPQKEILP